jgi:hypothetical protein
MIGRHGMVESAQRLAAALFTSPELPQVTNASPNITVFDVPSGNDAGMRAAP